jgi:hypothetical protein
LRDPPFGIARGVRAPGSDLDLSSYTTVENSLYPAREFCGKRFQSSEIDRFVLRAD